MEMKSGNLPAVHIYYCRPGHSPSKASSTVTEILFGVEEEGVMVQTMPADPQPAPELAALAAQSSPLGVGIGVGPGGEVAVTHKRLAAEKPLFYEESCPPWKSRLLGDHAARLVKGIPLREPGLPDSPDNIAESGDFRDLKEVVRRIAETILKGQTNLA